MLGVLYPDRNVANHSKETTIKSVSDSYIAGSSKHKSGNNNLMKERNEIRQQIDTRKAAQLAYTNLENNGDVPVETEVNT